MLLKRGILKRGIASSNRSPSSLLFQLDASLFVVIHNPWMPTAIPFSRFHLKNNGVFDLNSECLQALAVIMQFFINSSSSCLPPFILLLFNRLSFSFLFTRCHCIKQIEKYFKHSRHELDTCPKIVQGKKEDKIKCEWLNKGGRVLSKQVNNSIRNLFL